VKAYTYNLIKEPSGNLYSDLLDYALEVCEFFLLVTDRENKQLNSEGKRVLGELLPFLNRMEMKSEWPGTVLYGGEVQVYMYHYIPESVVILKKAANRLYQWQRPYLPDDLCLLRSDESPWLVTIAHENDSYLVLNEDDYLRLLNALPAYAPMIEIAKE
jgi:hypothetical protein